MDELQTFIEQAHQQGQTDEHIRQTLIASGWKIEQVDGAFATTQNPALAPAAAVAPLPAAAAQPTARRPELSAMPKQKSKLSIAMLCLLLLIVVIAGSSYVIFGQKTSYKTVAQKFVTAVQDKDKKTANSLESPAMQAEGKKYFRDSSFYDDCQQEGDLCTPFFTNFYLSKATKTYEGYTASNGVKGEQVVYKLKQTLSGGSAGCTSSSTNTLTISLIPKGSSWLIDDVSPTINANGQLCPATGGTSSVSD
jgi:hypothetical protein